MNEFEAPDWRALHSSLSRRKRFNFCPVGYYLYHVPGRDGYGNHPDEWHYRLYCAKHIVSADAWVKNLFIESVKSYFSPAKENRRGKFSACLRRAFEHNISLLENGSFHQDPKIVSQIIELEFEADAPTDWYDKLLWKISEMGQCFEASRVFSELSQVKPLEFYCNNEPWAWQLGGINFLQNPVLVWRSGGKLNILDMSNYEYEQQRSRGGLLYRVYCHRFMQIAPELVRIVNYDCRSAGECEIAQSQENFTEVFVQLNTEAEMWRDYLLKQKRDGVNGIWHYARKDHCQYCRFKELCPALSGTAEVENDSILSD